MPVYQFASTCGFALEQVRAIAERAVSTLCPKCDGLLQRDFASELATITINPVPLSFYTQWSDVYDISPKEMAQRQDIERYDPSLPHKPSIPRVDFKRHLPAGVTDIDTLVKSMAPVDGLHETDKLARRTAPIEGERIYG